MSDLLARVAPLQRETLEDGVFRRLCDLILDGDLVPGESVTVASLADAFEVSPMPVRKALTMLSGMGVLQVISGRTVGVPRLSLARLNDLRRVRLETEALAVRWAVKRCDDSLVDALSQALMKLRQTERKADGSAYIRANHAFHFALYQHADSPLMLSLISNHWLQITPFFHLCRESGDFRISNDCHEALFDSVRNGDSRGAVSALRADIEGAYTAIRQQI